MSEAYVTLATDDRYALGALVLAHSLRNVNTTRQLCILVTPGISEGIRDQLSNTYNEVISVDVMNSNDSAHLALLKRPELGVTFTKLHCWTLTQYKKCVFLDADMLAVQNADELFENEELSAVCDIGWPDCFNSGLFVFSPSLVTYGALLKLAEDVGSFDGGDQGLLNTYFTNWHRLSFIYNMVASVTYTYLPAYKQFGKNVKFVHFLGSSKPWQQSYHTESGTVVSQPMQEHVSSYLNSWWRIFASSVRPHFPESVINLRVKMSVVGCGEEERKFESPFYLSNSSDFSLNSSHVCPSDLIESIRNFPREISCDTSSSVKNSSCKFGSTAASEHSEYNSTYSNVSCSLSNDSFKQHLLNENQEPVDNSANELVNSSKIELSPSLPVTSSEPFNVSETTEPCSPTNTPTSSSLPFPTLENPRVPSPFSFPESVVDNLIGQESSSELCEHIDQLHICPAESLEDSKRRWEEGNPDFRGRDSFDNILAHIESVIRSE